MSVAADEIEPVVTSIQNNMANRLLLWRQEFYAHFYRGNRLIVVFRDAVFRVTTKHESWAQAIAHGKRLGIAEKQLDFSPCRVEDETF